MAFTERFRQARCWWRLTGQHSSYLVFWALTCEGARRNVGEEAFASSTKNALGGHARGGWSARLLLAEINTTPFLS